MKPTYVIVYSGRHYGRVHRVLSDNGRMLTVVHEPTGYTLTVPHFDVERLPPTSEE